MTKSEKNPKVDAFITNARQWKEEYEKLREIVLDCGLTEDFKWKHPCYTHEGKNVVLIHGFKEYCALLFHKRSLVKRSPWHFDPTIGAFASHAADPVYPSSRNHG